MTKKEDTRWTRDALLAEARRRMEALPNASRATIEHMLENLVEEAEWTGEELIDVLCVDVVRRSTRPPAKASGTRQKAITGAQAQKSAANVRRR
jgi:hypothetical protein